MRTCPDCHKLVNSQLRFCDNCGFPFPDLAGEAESAQAPAALETLRAGPVSPGAAGACGQCGYPFLAGEIFCEQCGARLEAKAGAPDPTLAAWWAQVTVPRKPVEVPAAPGVCPGCGQANPPGEPFCLNCGLQLAVQPLSETHTPAGQRPSSSQVTPRLAQRKVSGADHDRRPPAGTSSAATIQAGKQAGAAGGLAGALLVQASHVYLPLPPGRVEALLGRADPDQGFFPDIDLGEHGGELGGVSRKHARMLVEGEQVFLEDLDSTNFTFLNRSKLQPGQRYPLNDGDEIRLGRVILTYHARWG